MLIGFKNLIILISSDIHLVWSSETSVKKESVLGLFFSVQHIATGNIFYKIK